MVMKIQNTLLKILLCSLSYRMIPISSTYLASVEKIWIIMSQRVVKGFIIPTAMTTASRHDFSRSMYKSYDEISKGLAIQNTKIQTPSSKTSNPKHQTITLNTQIPTSINEPENKRNDL